MEKITPENYIQSSNLIFISTALGVLNMLFFTPDIFTGAQAIIIGIVTLGLSAGIGFWIRSGNKWGKYVFIALVLLGLKSSIVYITGRINNYPASASINIVQSILQIAACVILFIKPPKDVTV